MMNFNFESAIVPVTGAASGIGFAICKLLRQQGATPLLLDIAEDKLVDAARKIYSEASDPSRFSYVLDVSNSKAVDACFDAIRRDHGLVTHGVPSAGITLASHISDMSDSQWDRVMDINVNGVMYFSRAAGRHFVEAGKGALVTISSIAGELAKENRTAYCASKGAVVNLTRALALDFGRHGVRVNSVAPGAIDTPIQSIHPASYHEGLVARTAVGRMGRPDDIANAVLFLLSDLAGYITGQTVVVDGGLTIRYA